MTITAKSSEKFMEALAEVWENHVNDYAEKVRQELIIPACRKYGVSFMSGMGSYNFYIEGQPYGQGDIELVGKYRPLRKIIEVLDVSLPPSDHSIGHFVSDVKQEDL